MSEGADGYWRAPSPVTKYDDVDWHQPESNHLYPFCHIGMYLTWLMRNGLVRVDSFEADDLSAVLERRMLATDLEDEVDGKLVSDFLTETGRRFTTDHYSHYLEDWERTFGHEEQYSVLPTEENYAKVAGSLDFSLSSWRIQNNRRWSSPEDAPVVRPVSSRLASLWGHESPPRTRGPRGPRAPNAVDLAQLDPQLAGSADRLTVLTPAHVAGQSFTFIPVPVKEYSSRVARALRGLGADTRRSWVAVINSSDASLVIEEYHSPGLAARSLLDALKDVWLLASRFREYEGETWSSADVLVARRRYREWDTIAVLLAIDGALWTAFATDESFLRQLVAEVAE